MREIGLDCDDLLEFRNEQEKNTSNMRKRQRTKSAENCHIYLALGAERAIFVYRQKCVPGIAIKSNGFKGIQ